MTGPVLSLRDLTIRFAPGAEAVRSLSLELARGEVLSLIGESGSGKSATLGAIAGLLPRGAHVSGDLRLAGRDGNLLDPGADRRGVAGREIAMVFQNPGGSLNPVLTIGQHLDEVVRAHRGLGPRAARAASVDLLDRVGLPDPAARAETYPHQPSGGQKQRVAIACALAGEPSILLADEPTTALDATVQAQILDLLLGLVDERGIAMIFVTHDLAVAAAIGDRIAVMRGGRLLETGPARETAAAPRDPYTADLVQAALPFTRAGAARAQVGSAARPKRRDGLALRDIQRSFATRRGPDLIALDGVTLTVAPGEIVGLIGESGSGKTTLGRIAVGLDAPQAGSVLLETQPLDAAKPLPRAQRAAVQMVFQDPLASFNPRLSIARTLSHPLRIHAGLRGRAARDRTFELLRAVGLDPALGARKPHQVSGGQLQRAAIARALAAQPRILVCDEAVASLDVSVRAQVLDVLDQLRRDEGLGILFISHDLGVVQRIADRTIVLWQGRIVEEGPTAELLRAPRDAYTRRLLDAVPEGLTPWRQRSRAAG